MTDSGLIVVTGSSGAGKTTFLQQLACQQVEAGRSVGGILAPAVFECGRRIGYDLLDLQGGGRQPLARRVHVGSDTSDVGPYEFDALVVKTGNQTIIAALRARMDVVIIDEIGPLECRGGGWAPSFRAALPECGDGLTLIIAVRPALLDELPAHFPAAAWSTARQIKSPWPSEFPTTTP